MKITFKLSDSIIKLKCIAQDPVSFIRCGQKRAICGEFRVGDIVQLDHIEEKGILEGKVGITDEL